MERKTEPTRRSRAGAAIRFAVSVLIFLLIVATFFEVVSARRAGRVPTFFGYSFSVVVTGSMEPDIKVGEFLVVKQTAIEDVSEGDDILFTARSGAIAGERVVHRVIEVGSDSGGIYLRTKGTNNPVADADYVRADNYIGKAVAHNALVGKIVSFVSSTYALVAALMIIVVPFIVKQIIRIIKLAKSEGSSEDDDA